MDQVKRSIQVRFPRYAIDDGAVALPRTGEQLVASLGLIPADRADCDIDVAERQRIQGKLAMLGPRYLVETSICPLVLMSEVRFPAAALGKQIVLDGQVVAEPYLWAHDPWGWVTWAVEDAWPSKRSGLVDFVARLTRLPEHAGAAEPD